MPVFVEDPAQFSKPRLKSELIAHNVTLPAAESKKHVYMELYSKCIGLKSAADFSSDEEDVQESQDCEEREKDPEMIDPCGLTDDELKATLLQYGVEAGPIVGTTRSLYERKLQRLMELAGGRRHSETENADRYSYSEDELEDDQDSEQGRAETVSLVADKQHVDSDIQIGRHFPNNKKVEYHYHQCFLPSSRMRFRRDPGHFEFNPRRNAGNQRNVAESSNTERRNQDLPLPVTLEHEAVQSRTSSILGLPTESVQEAATSFPDKCTMTNRPLCITPKTSPLIRQIKVPIKDVLMEMFPETKPTPTGIAATRRRPIKGAAGRPVHFKYPDLPASPMAQQRHAVERHMVPLWVQILVFLILGCLLYVIYASMENRLDNPFVTLLDNLSVVTERETKGMSLQA
ncbi:LEM domain-containing protein 1 isoform X4 [Esox lucius]|uniref:LEM domain-containing protein n=1 Tax=Esox lucius TaxID=8010 RepID=A0AAY5L5W9_ESOLU|nr:LEM domain-containing protein 1 isoform X4 [Esox lucius]